MPKPKALVPYLKTGLGKIFHADSLEVMERMDDASVNLIMTSPPFALTRKKDYGNEQEDAYLEWSAILQCSFTVSEG
ncbi:hypothetical protein [Roseibium aggregatum]|nr:hypothetical protein [Roseibium aggregatum]